MEATQFTFLNVDITYIYANPDLDPISQIHVFIYERSPFVERESHFSSRRNSVEGPEQEEEGGEGWDHVFWIACGGVPSARILSSPLVLAVAVL